MGKPYRDTQSDDSAAFWQGTVTADVGGDTQLINFEFYSGVPTGAIDLTAGDQANYGTCSACIRIITEDASGTVQKEFFQDGGTLTLSADPLSTRHMTGSTSGVSLVEVTVDRDGGTYTSTPVPGGVCITLADLTLDSGQAPSTWTCNEDGYADGTACDCGCGDHDPDCEDPTHAVNGCQAMQTCGGADTCVNTCNVLSSPEVGCAAGTYCAYYSDVNDICYDNTADAAAKDAAVLGVACSANTASFCAIDGNNVATGMCDFFALDDDVCRKACDQDTDCGGGVCMPILPFSGKGVCVSKISNDTCTTATPVVAGTPVNGATGGGKNNYDKGLEAATCTNYAQPGADAVYAITLAANQKIKAELTNVSPDFDPSISILGPGTPGVACDDAGGALCVAGADDGVGGEGESVMYTATAAGTYYIEVDSFSASHAGTFTLTVTNQ